MSDFFTSQFKRTKPRIARNLFKAGLLVEMTAKNIVAIDTGELQQSIKTDPAIRDGDQIIVKVGSEGVDHAVGVEQGFGRVVRWHRDGRVVFVGDGMQYMERSAEIEKGNILKLVRQAVTIR